MKNKQIKKNPHAIALGRIGGKAGTGKAKARTSEQARAAVMNRWQSKYIEYETANGNMATRLTPYGREVAKKELLQLLDSNGPCRTKELQGTKEFHGGYTLSRATIRTLLNELEEAGQVHSRLGGQGMRTYHMWERQ